MKTNLLHLILFLLLTSPFAQAIAMGYPQDMFAEHVVVKPSAKASASAIHQRKPSPVAVRKKKIRESCPAKAVDVQSPVCRRSGRGVYDAGLASSAVLGMTIRMVEKQAKMNGVRPEIRFSHLPIGRLLAYLKVQLMALLKI